MVNSGKRVAGKRRGGFQGILPRSCQGLGFTVTAVEVTKGHLSIPSYVLSRAILFFFTNIP